jgi:short-subunit dehydrogenase
VQFRAVPVNFGADGYLDVIREATRDVPVQLVFNNAGYMTTGLFANLPLARHLANYECNATAGVKITHHFANRMIDEKLRGLIAFTSSPAGRMPNPSTSLYGATKAFISEFAASIAPELRADGIDVLAVHPSPIQSNFYNTAHDMVKKQQVMFCL